MKKNKTWVIRNAKLVNMASGLPELANLYIQSGKIIEIGQPDMRVPEGTAELNAHGMLIVPGLINAHTHGHGALSKGMGDLWTLELLLNAGSWLTANRLDEHKYLAAKVAAAEMIRKGCTGVYDLHVELPTPTISGMHAVANAYSDIGMRAIVSPMLSDLTFFEATPGLLEFLSDDKRTSLQNKKLLPWEETCAVARKIVEKWPSDRNLVAPGIAPTIPLHCSDEMLRGCASLARDLEIKLHMHLGESKVQALSGLKRYGKTLTHHLDDIGFLGSNFTAAHAVWLDDDDISRLADNGVSVAHNPGSNLRLGSGVARVNDMLTAGVNVGVGTDGAHCSDNQNMFEALRLAAYVSRVRTHNYQRWVSTEQAWDMATSGSARILGMNDVGRIEIGYRADLVFLDLNTVNWMPINNVINQLVMSEDATSVDTVLIDGRLVLREGEFVDFRRQDLAVEVESACEFLNRQNTVPREVAAAIEYDIGRFCIGLCGSQYHVEAMVGRDTNDEDKSQILPR